MAASYFTIHPHCERSYPTNVALSCLLFQWEIKVEYEIVDSFGRGSVNWAAVLMSDKIIVITEAKKDNIEQDISQNTVQLHSAIQRNSRL
ncbi:uncharacterized protein OCT59_016148 [Rhizophagus irregularis]|uniref:uncharacterized protein n=1 Tax=Rhizophagus irregularis TaxID=588596 RepID=UPI00333399FC|nr:hypothetical protein OCT59_016148 [Rhizophagus irregularis]